MLIQFPLFVSSKPRCHAEFNISKVVYSQSQDVNSRAKTETSSYTVQNGEWDDALIDTNDGQCLYPITYKANEWCGEKSQAPSTLIRFQTKTEAFCSGYGYRLNYNAENDHRKWSHSKTLSRVKRFENDAFWKRCFLVWTEKTMLSENGDVIKRDSTPTGRQTTRPWVSKMADRGYHVASISRQFRGPINWNAHASSSCEHAHG